MLRDLFDCVPWCATCACEITLHRGGILLCSCEEFDAAETLQVPGSWNLTAEQIAYAVEQDE